MNPIARHHIARLQTQVLRKYTARSVSRWITENTKLAGSPYSFDKHEYQEIILCDDSRLTNVQKCSQVGLSEANARKALATVNIMRAYTIAYTLPTAKFGSSFMQTRVQPIIDESDLLKDAVSKDTNNNEVKKFGDSYLWVRGAASTNAPISIPCDHLIHDEVDFSDQETLGQYISRLTHSSWQRIDRISTPTLPNFGINKHFNESRRWFNQCRCSHCNHWFIPDYYKHVRIPGFTRDLREMTKYLLTRINHQEAAVHCPACGGKPSLLPAYRQWVCENPDENHEAVAYQVTPFDAPLIVTPAQLVVKSTEYSRVQDFVNFSLGLPMEDREATLTTEDFSGVFIDGTIPGGVVFVMGIDVGNIYHFKIGAVDVYGDILGVLSERVPMGKAKERYRELRRQYRVVCTVIDSGPHAETVMALQDEDPSCYAAVYMRAKGVTTHNVVDKEGKEETGQEFVRQVNVNRNRALDAYMEFIRTGHYREIKSEETDLVMQHHTSMKRARIFDNDSGEMSFSWQKSDGIDHYHHAGLYMFIAAKMRGLGRALVPLPTWSAFKFKREGSF